MFIVVIAKSWPLFGLEVIQIPLFTITPAAIAPPGFIMHRIPLF
jgi:hypothetical protein